MIYVLHTIDTTGPGGAETVFVNIIRGLDPKRFRSFAVIQGQGWVCDSLKENLIRPTFVPSKGGFNIRYLLALVREIKQNKIDIVQSHLLGSNLYCSLAGWICRVPVIVTFHGFVDASASERLMRLKRGIINGGASKIVFVSNHLRDFYVNQYKISRKKSRIIYNGIDTDRFRPQKDKSIRKELCLEEKHVLIGALGNIRPAKGYHMFLKAARLVYDRYPNTRFLIAGQGSGQLYEDLLLLRSNLQLENVLFFLGFRKDATTFLNNLDIFVLPSTSEGFSISTIEAMACGLPVAVTNSGGPEEIVKDGYNGIIVNSSERDLANAIGYYISKKEFSRKIIENALQYVNKKFSLRKMIFEYSNCYENIYH